VDRAQRRFLACLTALAALAAVVQGMSGVTELALYLTPLFLVAALLLCGRYVAEDRIVRRWRAAVRRRRPCRERERRRPLAEAPLSSLLERSPRFVRGPPVAAA
jgi:hypothetical protein